MNSEENQSSPSMAIANEIINLANANLENGHQADAIAEGLRHAAANFSAYAFFRTGQSPKDPNHTVENFVQMFEYYLSVHMPKEEAGDGLAQTIAQAKDDL